MRALVTGAAGFVGRHLVDHLLAQGDEVCGVALSGEVSGIRMVPLDLRHAAGFQELVEEFRPEVVYHLAGIAFVPEAQGRFEYTLAVNVGGTHTVFRAVAGMAVPARVVLVSTGEVYGKVPVERLPITEAFEPQPANNYSLSKVMAETVAHRYRVERSIDSVIMRPFNHLGPGQDERFVAPSFATQLARIELGLQPPEIKVGNLDAQRDFSDVRDIVRAYRVAGQRGRGTYNLGSGRPVSVRGILDRLIQHAGIEVRITLDPERMRPSENPVIYTSIEKARIELGWSPEYSLQETLADVYASCRARVVAETERSDPSMVKAVNGSQ